jgi:miniconductance mechanosensitive channel
MLDVWIIFALISLLSAVLSGVNSVYMSYSSSKDKPIKVFIQVIEIFLYCAAVIVVIGMFTEKDVSTLLAGLTAFAAILMLIFKDSILGLVAGIQLSANNMVHVGDWIVMPSAGADGDVIEINLTTVKVQNFDKTITTIPTYKLVSESFTNWRGMEESNGRRIKRSVIIDVNSIHYLTEEEISTLIDSALLNSYMQKKLKDLEEYNASRKNRLDVRRLTNIGTFREYLESWIETNPDINQEMTHMVRQLQPTPTGLPIEIYCFSARQRWIDYENVQSDIFDHIYAILDLFNLRAFQFSNNTVVAEK